MTKKYANCCSKHLLELLQDDYTSAMLHNIGVILRSNKFVFPADYPDLLLMMNDYEGKRMFCAFLSILSDSELDELFLKK